VYAGDSPGERKGRGAFFTPRQVCEFISAWAIRSEFDTILEPSAGEAAFLLAAHGQLSRGGRPVTAGQLVGIEIHEASARAARAILEARAIQAQLRVADFFDVPARAGFDAVIGNPPFLRFQVFTGESRRKGRTAALRQGVNLSRLASSWAAFTIHAAGFLRDGGRLGLVLPAELLSVNYAAAVRAFLLRRFGSVRLVLFGGRVFPEVTEEVLLLLAEGAGPTNHLELYQAEGLDDLQSIGAIEWRRRSPGRDRWSNVLMDGEGALVQASLVAGDILTPLRDWGDPTLGMVTGSNGFFSLSESSARESMLPESELLPISPPGSRHLRGLSFTRKDWAALKWAGKAVYLFDPSERELSLGAQQYIGEGEAAGIHLAYKCRVRSPWWKVPRVAVPDLFLTYMNHDAPRLVSNRAGVAHLNSIHGLRLLPGRRRVGMDLLPLGSLNSASLLSAELTGRSYGGGILKLEPREAEDWLVPSITALERAGRRLREVRKPVALALARGELESAAGLVDSVLLESPGILSRESLEAVREARRILFRRRVGRSR